MEKSIVVGFGKRKTLDCQSALFFSDLTFSQICQCLTETMSSRFVTWLRRKLRCGNGSKASKATSNIASETSTTEAEVHNEDNAQDTPNDSIQHAGQCRPSEDAPHLKERSPVDPRLHDQDEQLKVNKPPKGNRPTEASPVKQKAQSDECPDHRCCFDCYAAYEAAHRMFRVSAAKQGNSSLVRVIDDLHDAYIQGYMAASGGTRATLCHTDAAKAHNAALNAACFSSIAGGSQGLAWKSHLHLETLR